MPTHVPEEGLSTIEANGLTFGYLEEGEGPLVLMLHGFPDTAHTWDDVRPRLAAEGYRVVTPFLRGYAPTTAPATDDYGAVTLGQDIVALIDALGGEAIVVGHDWGALSAYSAASQAPDKVRKLVAVAIPHPASIRFTLSEVWGARHFVSFRLPGAVGRHAAGDFACVRTMYERWSPGFDWPDSEFESVKNSFGAPGSFAAALGYYRCLEFAPPKPLRTKLEMPTLLIGGRTDGVATEEAFQRSATRHTGPWELAMLPGGHFLHREHPEPFFETLRDWLAR